MTTTFATMTEATEYVTTALGTFATDYDVEAIANEITDWVDGKLTLTTDEDTFWDVAEKHAKCFNVIICDERENVTDTYVDEMFDSLAEAQERFDGLKEDFDFNDHDELWLSESTDGGNTWTSIDGYTAEDRN